MKNVALLMLEIAAELMNPWDIADSFDLENPLESKSDIMDLLMDYMAGDGAYSDVICWLAEFDDDQIRYALENITGYSDAEINQALKLIAA